MLTHSLLKRNCVRGSRTRGEGLWQATVDSHDRLPITSLAWWIECWDAVDTFSTVLPLYRLCAIICQPTDVVKLKSDLLVHDAV